MSSRAILVDRLGKQYLIGAAAVQHKTLRDAIAYAAAAPLRNLRRLRRAAAADGQHGSDLIWALRDVAFEVEQGEVLGLIGRNGAGKSTLLKILSRITAPTTGCAEVWGRVGSLLEVGTGFHQELTGRDNIYLNGSVLGMDRRHIDRQFDEIVEFAAVGHLLDTPVKRYSSGMSLRLAFAVAAHLESDVLMVDEVLAVGDAEFQKKCLGKMSDIANQGRTILFVSHDLNAIQRMCSRCLLLEGGRLVADAPTPEVLRRYLATGFEAPAPRAWIDTSQAPRRGTREAFFEAVAYQSDNAAISYRAYPDGPLEFKLAIASDVRRTIGSIGISLYDERNTKLLNADTMTRGMAVTVERGRTVIGLRLAALHLNAGSYRVGLRLYDPLARQVLDHVDAAFTLEVVDLQPEALGRKVDGATTCSFEVVDGSS